MDDPYGTADYIACSLGRVRVDPSLEAQALIGEETQDPEGSGLTERQLAMLEFEQKWWKYAGAKEAAVRDAFDCSPTRYYQELNALLDRPEALPVDPLLVKRLRRLRGQRQQQRSARRLGFEI